MVKQSDKQTEQGMTTDNTSVSTQNTKQNRPKCTHKKTDPATAVLDVQADNDIDNNQAVSDTQNQPSTTKAKAKSDQNKPKKPEPVKPKTPKILTIKPKAKPTIKLPSQNTPAKKRLRQTSVKKLMHSRAMSQPQMSGADHVLVPKKPFWNLLRQKMVHWCSKKWELMRYW